MENNISALCLGETFVIFPEGVEIYPFRIINSRPKIQKMTPNELDDYLNVIQKQVGKTINSLKPTIKKYGKRILIILLILFLLPFILRLLFILSTLFFVL